MIQCRCIGAPHRRPPPGASQLTPAWARDVTQAGSNINDFQAKTYARIQLSKAGEYYPGTAERTLLITGRIKQVVAALGLTLGKLLREGVAPLSPRSLSAAEGPPAAAAGGGGADPSGGEPPSEEARLVVKLLVPQPLCGIIIGRSGATVRAYAADTGTQIRVAAPEGAPAALSHRVVTVAGRVEGVLKATALLMLKQCEDPKYAQFGELPPSYAAGAPGVRMLPAGVYPVGAQQMLALQQMQYVQYMAAMNAAGGGAGGGGPGAAGMYGVPSAQMPQAYGAPGGDAFTNVAVAVTDEQAEVLLGRAGRGIDDIQAAAGVRVRVEAHEGPGGGGSAKGARLKRITISGSPEGVQYAHFAMSQRLAVAAMQQQQAGGGAGGGGGGGGGGAPPRHYSLHAYPGSQVNGTTYYPQYRPGYQGDAAGGRPSPRGGQRS